MPGEGELNQEHPACCLLLHCPTGHLSAAVAGIACGLLPPAPEADGMPDSHRPPDGHRAPRPETLRRYFRLHLVHRRFGRLNLVRRRGNSDRGPGSGPGVTSVLCLGRGGAGPIVETALRQVARVAGSSAGLWIQPALRMPRARAGDGQSPVTPAAASRIGLAAAALAARACTHLGLYAMADALMASAVLGVWPEVRARAASLPGTGLAAGSGPDPPEPATGGAGSRRLAEGPGKVLYHCFGATHSSVVAAAMHCGILRRAGGITTHEVEGVPGFDRRAGSDIGHAFFVGADEDGCEAFAIGFGGARGVLTRASVDLLERTTPVPRRLLLADTLTGVSPLVRLGGYLSRRCRLVWVGRKMAAYGIVASAAQLQGVVADARNAVGEQARRSRSHAAAEPAAATGPPPARAPSSRGWLRRRR